MSTQIFYLAKDLEAINIPYISSLLVMMGVLFLVESLNGIVFTIKGKIAINSVVFIISLTGLIMGHSARGTRNKSKIVGIFACMMTGALFFAIALLSIVLGLNTDLDGLALVNEGGRRPPRKGEKLYISGMHWIYISWAAYFLKYLLSMVSGIVLLHWKSNIERPSCPQVLLPSKLMIGIPIIILSPLAGALVCITSIGLFKAYYYSSIAGVSIIGLAIVLGIVLEILNYKKRNEHDSSSTDDYQFVQSTLPQTMPPPPMFVALP